MPSPTRLEKYPGWMLALAADFEPPTALRKRVYELADPAEARTLRSQLYGFQRALEHDARAMYPNFLSTRLVIRGSELHIIHADDYIPQPPEKS